MSDLLTKAMDATAAGGNGDPLSLHSHSGVIVASGELDTYSAPDLQDALARLVAVGGHITIDARAVTFIGSGGLRVLADAAAALGSRGRITIVAPSRAVLRAIELVGLHPAIAVAAEAVGGMAAGGGRHSGPRSRQPALPQAADGR